jgi:hypothetical protein
MLIDEKRTAHRAVVARILEGDGRTSRAQRRAAFDDAVVGEPLQTLTGRVAREPALITDADIVLVKKSGLSEDEVFELVVCAAVGQATRQYECALAALAEASADRETR